MRTLVSLIGAVAFGATAALAQTPTTPTPAAPAPMTGAAPAAGSPLPGANSFTQGEAPSRIEKAATRMSLASPRTIRGSGAEPRPRTESRSRSASITRAIFSRTDTSRRSRQLFKENRYEAHSDGPLRHV